MIYTTEIALALSCPKCGKVESHHVSLLSFSGKRTLKVGCSCGVEKFSLGFQGTQFWLNYPCPYCHSNHVVYYPKGQFWDTQIKTLICPQTRQESGWMGPLVEGEMHKSLQMLNRTNANFFRNPEVVSQILDALNDAAEAGRLVCACGLRTIRVDVFPDRLLVNCTSCGRFSAIPAVAQQDLRIVERIRHSGSGEFDWKLRS